MLLTVLQYAAKLAFFGLGAAATRDWLRHRDRRHGYLALALGMLGLVALVGLATQALDLGAHPPAWIGLAEITAFQASGWAFLMFRHTFIPLPRWAHWLAPLALFLTAAAVEAEGVAFGSSLPALTAFTSLLVVVSWSVCVGEPAVRFWLAARDLPTVQRHRVRALSYGYAGLIPVLLLGTVNPGSSGGVVVLVFALALLAAPALYSAFSPPRLLRLVWREEEEDRYRLAVNDLMIFAPDRHTLAERALEWAIRLVGGNGGMVVEPDGSALATAQLEPARAERLAAVVVAPPGEPPSGDVPGGLMVEVPMQLDVGVGHLVVVGGAFTPLFAGEEVNRLRQYASSLAIALDRARLSERMRALEETKSRFLRLASHELRGPLTLIRGYVSMLDEGALSVAEMKEMAPMLLSRVTQMTRMLNEMLETARLEDERLELDLEVLDLRDAARDVVDVMMPFAGDHEVVLDLPDAPVTVEADRARVENIISILLDNAIKYSPRGGHVWCYVRAEGSMGTVDVVDEGVGITAEEMPLLFTRFGRLHNPATSAVSGTGLGLYLSRELARRFGGDLGASSVAGRGSTFKLRLPLAEEPAADA